MSILCFILRDERNYILLYIRNYKTIQNDYFNENLTSELRHLAIIYRQNVFKQMLKNFVKL